MIILLLIIQNGIGDGGAKAISKALKKNSTLNELSIYFTHIKIYN